jgi:hypothetical protein
MNGTKTVLMRLIEEKLGGADEPVDLYDWLIAQRTAGKTFQTIAYELHRRADVDVVPETVRQWVRQGLRRPSATATADHPENAEE